MTRTTSLTRRTQTTLDADHTGPTGPLADTAPVGPPLVRRRGLRLARSNGLPGVTTFSGSHLLRTAQLLASDPGLSDRLTARQSDPTGRRWTELESSPQLQIWLIGWPPGSSTGWHDHGEARGAFLVTEGALVEQTWTGRGARERALAAGDGRTFGGNHVHNVLNAGAWPAISVHLYTPRLSQMTRYAVTATGLQVRGVERAGGQW